MSNRKEHIDWCVKRATRYLDENELSQGIASFFSDMSKTPETAQIIAIFISIKEADANTATIPLFRTWINGFQ